MKAIVLDEVGKMPTLKEVEYPDVSAEDLTLASVEVQTCALNHRDLWIVKGRYPGIAPPVILGSDAFGEYEGENVVIQPGLFWGDEPRVQSARYQILGVPGHGSFANWVVVPKGNVFPAPAHLNPLEAAALPLAGITAYRVLFTRCTLTKTDRILITGIGGGVATTCLLFALAAGAEAWVTSGSDEKIDKAIALGAKGGVNYRRDDWSAFLEKMAGQFDVIIDSAGGPHFAKLVGLCAPAGRIGIYGGGQGELGKISPQIIFWRQITICGSTMGSNRDFTEMLSFVETHRIRPVIDSVFPLADFAKAFNRMEAGKQFGKIVMIVSPEI